MSIFTPEQTFEGYLSSEQRGAQDALHRIGQKVLGLPSGLFVRDTAHKLIVARVSELSYVQGTALQISASRARSNKHPETTSSVHVNVEYEGAYTSPEAVSAVASRSVIKSMQVDRPTTWYDSDPRSGLDTFTPSDVLSVLGIVRTLTLVEPTDPKFEAYYAELLAEPQELARA